MHPDPYAVETAAWKALHALNDAIPDLPTPVEPHIKKARLELSNTLHSQYQDSEKNKQSPVEQILYATANDLTYCCPEHSCEASPDIVLSECQCLAAEHIRTRARSLREQVKPD